MAHDGFARAISPVHTTGDGDTIFSLATGALAGEVNDGRLSQIGALAAEAMADAIVRAVREATTAGGVPALRDLQGTPAAK
jgi:L-aminopeptidase/D-esterase-like protein